MRWIVWPLVAVLLVGLALLSLRPGVDAICVVQAAHDRLQHRHAGWSCLHYAAARGDLAALDSAITQTDASVDARTGADATPLALAAGQGQLPMVKQLLARDADIDATDAQRRTPLYRAAAAGHPAVVRALIAGGAAIDQANELGQTPLWINAARSPTDNTEIAHSLVRAGATIDRPDRHGDTPLMAAARAGHTDVLAYLLEQHADPARRNDAQATALFLAISQGHTESVRQLLARGADPNAAVHSISPLAAAQRGNRAKIVRLLRANGAGE